MREIDVEFLAQGTTLAGTLAVPSGLGPFPAVVLITGSGPVDRNENVPRLKINLFGELAPRLADAGFASLRYDKRGVGESDGDFWTAGFHSNIVDASAALEALRGYIETDPEEVFLLGHSEGALIAIELAAHDADVGGAVLLSGAARSGEEVLLWQGKKVAEGLSGFSGWAVRTLRVDPVKQQRKQLERLKRSDSDVLRVQLVAKVNAKWMREFMAHDPAESFPKIRVPVLAITGTKDIQVPPEDLERLAELADTEFSYHVIPEVSHILRVDPSDPPGLKDYKRQVKEPVDERVIDLVLGWLSEVAQRATA